LFVAVAATAGASALVVDASAHRAQRGLVRLGGSPGFSAANPKTHTLYVPIQCQGTQGCPGKPTGHLVDVIDTARCNAQTTSGCRVVATVDGGKGPLATVIDQRTDTVYVIDGAGRVSVIDGGRCNATVRTDCKVLATVRTGGFDVAGALNSRTHTLYVAAPSGDVFVIDVARCDAETTRGCRQHVRRVSDPRGPGAVDVDLATNTVYVADGGTKSPGDTVTVINGARCNGSIGSGCARRPRTVAIGPQPFWIAVDQHTNTVYTANFGDGTVSIVNGARCNGRVASGCSRRTRAVPTGSGPGYVAIDQSRHTVFTLNQTDDTMSEFDARTCNARMKSGCPARARNGRVIWNPPSGYNPSSFTLVPGTGTAYVANPGGENFLAAVSIKRCNALTTRGCRVEAPSQNLGLGFGDVDPTTDTIYAANGSKPGIQVLDGAKCTAGGPSRCRPVAKIPFPHPAANLGSIDETTHTLYAADTFADTVYAIDLRHCSAHDTSGCGATPPRITVGLFPSFPALNPVTHTLYVPDATGTTKNPVFNDIAVLNAATCNALNTSGCGQTPARVTVAENVFDVGVSADTNTVYAATLGANFSSRRIWVVNGAACNALDHSGCGHAVVAKAKVGLQPDSLVVDDSHHTVYVANNANGDLPGTVSVLNSATCNGTHTTGCAKPAATVGIGRSPTWLALDPGTHRVYAADFSQAAISIIDGANCNASHTSRCRRTASEQAVGSQPGFVFVNPRKRTVFAAEHNSQGNFLWSIFPESR
jgi:DNA-binding beta-propeller fold protein YncE